MVDGKPRIGDEVYIHGYIDEIRNDVVIIRNVGGYFGTSRDEVFYYEEDGYGTMNEADRKTEPTISKMEQVEDEPRLTAKCLNCANGSSYKCSKCDGEMYYKYDKDEPQTDCFLCKWLGEVDVCGRCRNRNLFAEADTEPKPKDEPQTERSE